MNLKYYANFALPFPLAAAVLPAQVLSNDEFRVAYSSTGLSSLKRVRDAFDTHYVLPGKSLGDIVLRYRVAGRAEWQRVSDAAVISSAFTSARVGFHIGRAVPTIATAAHATSSVVRPALEFSAKTEMFIR